MKNQIYFLLIFGLILINLSVSSQTTGLAIKKINGTEYYIYTVQPKEGLYSISKRFSVTQAEINNANPEIGDGLKIGQQLLIPKNKNFVEKTIQTEKPEVKVQKTKQEFIEHKVERRQTLFAISRLYDITQEEIVKYNPGVDSKLKTGTILQIPIKSTAISPKNEKQITQATVKKAKKSKIHIVQKKETLYSISRLYDVEVVDIIELNPGSERKLSINSELKIPEKKSGAVQKQNIQDTIVTHSGIVLDLNKIFSSRKPSVAPIKIAFLLPFMLDQNSNISGADRFVDFYTGALLAVHTAKENGLDLEITTFDTEKSVEKLNELLSNPKLKSMDLIIGPAFTNQLATIAEFSKNNRINTLIPFSSKVPTIESNPYLFQFNPGIDTEIKYSAELMAEKFKYANIIFAEIPIGNEINDGSIFYSSLKNELSRFTRMYTTAKLKNADDADFSTYLKKGKQNIIIFNTDKFSQVQPYLKTLISNKDNNDIQLFNKLSWLNQAGNELSGFYISPFTTDYNQLNLGDFNRKYTKFFNSEFSTELPRFDLLGFDLTSYFIDYFNDNAKKTDESISNFKSKGLIQSQPKFERTNKTSGYINQQLYLGTIK